MAKSKNPITEDEYVTDLNSLSELMNRAMLYPGLDMPYTYEMAGYMGQNPYETDIVDIEQLEAAAEFHKKNPDPLKQYTDMLTYMYPSSRLVPKINENSDKE